MLLVKERLNYTKQALKALSYTVFRPKLHAKYEKEFNDEKRKRELELFKVYRETLKSNYDVEELEKEKPFYTKWPFPQDPNWKWTGTKEDEVDMWSQPIYKPVNMKEHIYVTPEVQFEKINFRKVFKKIFIERTMTRLPFLQNVVNLEDILRDENRKKYSLKTPRLLKSTKTLWGCFSLLGHVWIKSLGSCTNDLE